MKKWWVRNLEIGIVMMVVCLGILGLAMSGGQRSWRRIERAKLAESVSGFAIRQQYSGRPIKFSELPGGNYKVLRVERHLMMNGKPITIFAIIVRPSDGDVRFVSEVPQEYFREGANFTVMEEQRR